MSIMRYSILGKALCSLVACMPALLYAQNDIQYNAALEADSVEQTQIAFRKKDKKDILGGVSTVNIKNLLEKNYTTYSLDNLEAWTPGFHGNIWGQNGSSNDNNAFLVLIDGIPRDANNVMPTEIEEITVLKSAAAVTLYGSRASKGVILITTKRGQAGNQRIHVRANAGLHTIKSLPKYLGSAEYMTLYNEARRNDGLGDHQDYTTEAISNHASGINPYRYPSIDFYSADYMNRTYNRYDATAEITGGNERAKYYTNFGWYHEGSLLNFGEAADNHNQRFNARGNVDVNIIKNLDAFVDASLSFYNGRGVNGNFFSAASTVRPNRFAPLISISYMEENDLQSNIYVQNSQNLVDGKYLLGGRQDEMTNAIAALYAGGTNTFTSRQFQFSTGIAANLESLLDGLTFKTVFGLDYSVSYNLVFNRQYATYGPSWTSYDGTDAIASLTRYNQDSFNGVQNIQNNWFRQTSSLSSQLNYDKQFGNKHNVSAMVVANGYQQAISGAYHRISNVNLGLQASYNYDSRYYADFSGSIIHSARLPEGNRKAFNPTASLAWRLSKEKFMANAAPINDFRLTASAGIIHTDLDISDYYMYANVLRQGGDPNFSFQWRDGALRNGVVVDQGGNPFLSFPKREEITLGVDGALFDNSVLFNATWFSNRTTGLLVQREQDRFPSYFRSGWPVTSFIPHENFNADSRTGFDAGVTFQEKSGAVNWKLGLTATYYKTTATKRSGVWQDAYQNRNGIPVDAVFGLENLGLFKDATDIAESPNQNALGGNVKPGDIKYKDQNGDGIINAQDEVYLGRGGWFGSPFILGTNITVNYQNFTLFALGALRTGGVAMRNSSYFWIGGEDKYSEIVRDRWTPETAETATFPRLTTLSKGNNFRSSDFWLYSTNRFDLARVQLSYTVPKGKLTGNKFLHGLQAYVNGVNLLTISPNREILEMNIGSSPQTRFFNIGVKADF